MKKKKWVLLSLICALAVSASMLAFTATSVHAVDETVVTVDGSAASLQILDVRMETDGTNDTKKVGFVINQTLGKEKSVEDAAYKYAVQTFDADKVTYTVAGGGTRTLEAVHFNLFEKATAGLVFSFAEDETENGAVRYGEGDTITIRQGFTVSDWEGQPIGAVVAEDITVTYTNGQWTGTFADAAAVITAEKKPATIALGTGYVIDFGLSNATGDSGYIDMAVSSNFGHVPHITAQMKKYVTYTYNGNVYFPYGSCTYAGVFGAGKFEGYLGVAAFVNKDYIHFKKGFVLYSLSNVGGDDVANHALYPHDYRPVLVLHEDVAFRVTKNANLTRIAEPATAAEFTNTDEEKRKLCVNTTMQLTYDVTTSSVIEPLPTFSSSDESVATVSATGLVTGLKEGTTTITAQFMKVSASMELTVKPEPVKQGLAAEVQVGATKNGVKGLVVYKGDAAPTKADVIRSVQKARFVYDEGTVGDEVALTENNFTLSIDGFSSETAGETEITVTMEGQSCTIPVYVYETKEIADIDGSCIMLGAFGEALTINLGDRVEGALAEKIITSDIRDLKSLIGVPNQEAWYAGVPANMIEYREPAHEQSNKKYEFYTVGQLSNKRAMFYFGNISFVNGDGFRVGSVLTFKKNFRFYFYIDEFWIAAYKFADEVAFVWTGSEWVDFTADASGVTLDKASVTMPINAEYDLEYTAMPAGSYVSPTLAIAEGAEFVEIKGTKIIAKAAGNAVVTVTVCQDVKTLAVEVVQALPKKIELYGRELFYVAQGAEFDVTKIRYRVAYSDDFYGAAAFLTESMVTNSTVDTSQAGQKTAVVSVSYTENGVIVTADFTIRLDVKESVEQIPDNLWCNDDEGNYLHTIAIHFTKTFVNTANVDKTVWSDEVDAHMKEHVTYTRGDKVYYGSPVFLQNMLVFTPLNTDKLDGNGKPTQILTYKEGDVITLKKGLCFYQWFGEKNAQNTPIDIENGDCVKVGELMCDILFVYKANGKFHMQIQYETGRYVEETVSVGLGTQHMTNVTVVPSYATVGEWSFSVADSTVASVNTSGVITGLKIGSTTVEATLRGGTVGDITVTFTVNVVDAVTGVKITAPAKLRVPLGTELDGDKLAELGITVTKVWASGKVEGDVDIKTMVRLTGYDPEKEGEQEVTLRFNVEGNSVAGKLLLTVGDRENKGCGCGGALSTDAILFGSIALVTAMLIVFSRRAKKA